MRRTSKTNGRSNRKINTFLRFIEPLEQRQLLAGDVRFAVIGDFGANTPEEGNVATLINGWNPDLILTVGDNNYQLGAASTIDANIGKYYHDYISPYKGSFGAGSADGVNHFFPTLGNHEWMAPNAQPHLDYFTLPGNERYYTFTQGAVQFFAIDADPHEPDLGYVNATTSTENSIEAQWLKNALAASSAPWKIVYFHQPAYSSGTVHGSAEYMQWPFEQWGADAVLSGHEHNYERLNIGNIPYFVNGLGGAENVYTNFRNPPLAGSAVRYSSDFGAMRVDANDTRVQLQFITRAGQVIDSYTLASASVAPAAPSHLAAIPVSSSQVQLKWRDQSNNETAFEIWRSFDNVNFTHFSTTAANATSFTDTQNISGTRYYRVRAINGAGMSAFSNTAATNAPIPAPSNLVASGVSSSQIRLTWRDNSDNETRFEVLRSTDNSTFLPIANVPADTTSFTDSGLVSGRLYYYRVRAANGTAISAFSNTVSATPSSTTGALAAPSELSADPISSSQIQLTWEDNSTNETRFEIWRSTNGTTFAWRAQVGANVTNFTDSGLTSGVTYYYRVRANNATAGSAFSNTASATPTGSTSGAPAAPSNLSAAATSSSQIQLNWQDHSSNENNFEIWRSTDNVSFSLRTTVGANTTSFTDNGLATNVTYFYRIRATNGSGNSGFSNTASATTGSTTSGVPAAPTNLTAAAISSSSITLNWDDNSSNESRFEIFRSTDGVNFAFRAQVGVNATSFTDTGLTSGTTYFYRVRGVNTFGNSAWSNIASATPGGTTSGAPAAPSNLTAAVASSTQVNLNWLDNSSNEDGFQIFRSDDGGVSYSQIAQVGPNVTSFSNNALVTGKQYFYRVRAFNSLANSAFSNTVSATPSTTTTGGVPVGPTSLVATGGAAGQIQLTWQDNSNNETRFEIFRSTSPDGGFAFIAQVGAGATNFTNSGLTPGAVFFYRVRAVNASGNSAWSNVANATVSGTGGGGGGGTTTVPAAPTSLSAQGFASGQIQLSWQDNSDNENRFEIFRSTSPDGGFAFVAQVGAGVTNFLNTGLTSGGLYYYRVRAVNSVGNSAWTNVASARASAPPTAASTFSTMLIDDPDLALTT